MPRSAAKRRDPFLQRIALIGERDLGALSRAGLGDTPGDRSIVGDAHDQPAFAGHQRAGGDRHVRLRPRHGLDFP